MSERLRKRLVYLFNLLDADGNGSLDAKEFVLLARAMGHTTADEAEAQRQIDRADKDHNGILELEEWLNFSKVLAKRGEEAAITKVEELIARTRVARGLPPVEDFDDE